MTLIEAIQKANNGKTFGLKCDQIGEILVSQEGLKIINQHPHKVERFFTGLYDRKNEWDLSREEGGNKDFFYLQEDHLRPHVKEKQIYLGRGSEGAAFQMPNLDLVLKFYDQEGSGIDLFNSLSDVPQSTVFRTPQPYFASDNLLAQEDFTKFQNYLDFVKANPNEKSRILKYL